MTCGRTQEYLASHDIAASTEVNAKKNKLTSKDALKLLEEVDEVYAAKGKNVVHLDLRKENPTENELAGLLLGPTGNLRAPALRKGRTLIVGFDKATYEKL